MTALDLGAIARALGGEVSGRRVLAPGPEQPPVRSASTKPVGRTDWKEVARAAWEAPSWREAALDYHKNRPTSPQPSERLLIPEREIWRAAGQCIRRKAAHDALRTFLRWCDRRGVSRHDGLPIFQAIVDKELAR